MRIPPAIAAAGLLVLGTTACQRSEPTPAADLSPLCAAPETLSALQGALLPPGKGRRYMARMRAASLNLSGARATASDPAAARCAANAVLASPLAKDDPRAMGQVLYTVRPGDGGAAPRLSDVRMADGGDVGRFAELLRHPRLADIPPDTSSIAQAAPPPPVDDTAPHAPALALSPATQSLVDQAGDTRSAGRRDADPSPPDPGLNSIAGTY